MIAATARLALPTRIVRPTDAPMRETSGPAIHTVPGAGEPCASRSGAPGASATRMRPRSGKAPLTALISARFTPAGARDHAREGRLAAIASPPRPAASAKAGGTGWSAITTRSPPSSSLACASSAPCTRSAKKPTVVTLATAMKSAAASTLASPAWALRRSMRIAMATFFTRFTSPAAIAMRRSQRAASASSCVTRTSVVPWSRFIWKRSSITCAPVAESRLPVGSSAKRSLGSVAKARATATRCCSPPESWRG